MYHIHAEQQGDAQAGVLYGQFLYVAYLGHSFQIEKPSHEPLLNLLGHVAALCLTGGDLSGHGQVELADFLFHSHPAHQCVDEAVHVLRRFLRLHGGGDTY